MLPFLFIARVYESQRLPLFNQFASGDELVQANGVINNIVRMKPPATERTSE